MPGRSSRVLALLLVAVWQSGQSAAPQEKPVAETRWADWVESGFPFFSSVVDARGAGVGAADNLSPRALVLNLGGGCWAAFDTDLLRLAVVWHGAGLSADALAPGSYHRPDKKTPGGQSPLPTPVGTVWTASGIYPGWQAGERPDFRDPRDPAPSPEEVGRGPLPEPLGRFEAVHLEPDGVRLEYVVNGVAVRERLRSSVAGGRAVISRHIRMGPSDQPLLLAAGAKRPDVALELPEGAGAGITAAAYSASGDELPARTNDSSATWMIRVPPHRNPVELAVTISGPAAALHAAPSPAPRPDGRRWPQEVTTRVRMARAGDAFVVDDVPLPEDNPWRRSVRPGDIQFLRDGTGAVITLDGDVWLVRGLAAPDGVLRWRRFASGLHEPLTLAVRDDEIFAFDRNGIWRLRDLDGNGEADVHELFSNAFAQTADMREFPSTVRPAPGGEFVIAKGGQEAATIGKHNGSVLRISAYGRRSTVLGYGFRQPNISVNPRSGLVIASDQQGHYIPTTPLHVVRDRQFYGFLSDKLPREMYPAPIAEPLTWIPHAANASAMSQVWLYGARMGPLNDALVHIGFNNPELHRVLLNERMGRLQAAVVSVTRNFDFPPLNGSVNPADGQLYLAGFQIFGWGTTATRLAGLGRVRFTGAPFTGPREVVPTDSGVLLRFDVPLDSASAGNADNFSITSWQYKRTYQYGSPQFKADGSPGIDRLVPSRAYVSADRLSVFVAVPGMRPVMQMRVAWTLRTAGGQPFQESAYLTPYELAPFAPDREGFGDIDVDLTPRAAAREQSTAVSAREGERLAQLYGCRACHGIDAAAVSRLGPAWKGLFGSERSYAKGVLRTTADEAYLRESILDPPAKVVTGFERGESGMPSYSGVLTTAQVDSIIEYIKTLK